MVYARHFHNHVIIDLNKNEKEIEPKPPFYLIILMLCGVIARS
jgi:hypothetical protein